jgi:DNA (cytosine-5)-methyltransferase 1
MRLLELYACEGGASAGYQRAGWEVTAVDIDPNRLKYNPADHKVIADAYNYVTLHGHEYDAIHASPPCQWYTRGNAANRGTESHESKWERSIQMVREAIRSATLASDAFYVIENVRDAGWDMTDPVTLCGCQFGLSTVDTDGITIHLQRQRLFETNWGLKAPRECDHSWQEWWAGAYGGARRDKYEAKYVRKGGYVPREKSVVAALLGVEHEMTWNGLYECLPPAYTHYIGTELAAAIGQEKAA